MKDYYYYRKDKMTAEELFKIEQIVFKNAIEKKYILFDSYFMLLPLLIFPNVLTLKEFQILISKN